MTQPICPKCNSKKVRHRIKKDSYVCERCSFQWPRTEDIDAEANAHLIAAAPDMYEALKTLCLAYDEGRLLCPQNPYLGGIMRQAIAKAEGK
jgi:transposase-like protein